MSGGQLLESLRPAPNFFIVGAAKAGTTSLHAYLRTHPDVFMSAVKEPHFFSAFEVKPEFDNFMPPIRDVGAYRDLFRGSEAYKAVGEASPSYLWDPDAAVRIKSAIPHARIIISLRNPVQRAFSHYLMEFHAGRETLPFERAIEADQLRVEKGWGTSFQYVELGMYAGQVERYLTVFGHENVLILLFEEMIRDTASTMRDVARFLDIDPDAFLPFDLRAVHFPFEASRGVLARKILRWRSLRVGSRLLVPRIIRRQVRDRLLYTKGAKPHLDATTRKLLEERFSPDLRRLEVVLGRDLTLLRRYA